MANTFLLKLSINDTLVLKGVALLLLLCHHCWYTGEGYDDIVIHGLPIFKNIGVYGKLCVSLFVFLSGYGLTVGTMNNNGIGKVVPFYKKRFVKLMVNYWLIWLLFVPLGVFAFNRTFPDVYGENYIIKAIADIMGLYSILVGNAHGYNPTWWFYSCIIMLYFLYPLMWKYRKFWFLLVSLAMLIPDILGYSGLYNGGFLSYMFSYSLPFVCGMLFANSKLSTGDISVIAKAFLMVGFLLLCVYSMRTSNKILGETLICMWGVFLYKQFPHLLILSKVFAFLGKHSFNIFLFHTFIYSLYFHDYIYWSRNSILILFTLLLFCIPISMFIEYLRKLLKLDLLQLKLTK